MGCGFAIGESRRGAHQLFGIVARLVVGGVQNHHQSAALLQRLRDAAAEAFLVLAFHGKFVNHNFNVMVFVAVHLHVSDDLSQCSIDAHGQKAFAAHGLEEFFVVSLAVSDERRKEIDLVPFILLKDELDDFLFGVFHHLLSRLVGVGVGCAGVEETQEVIDFRHRSHRGARVAVGGFLFDADDGAESCDFVHVGSFEVVEEVASVG